MCLGRQAGARQAGPPHRNRAPELRPLVRVGVCGRGPVWGTRRAASSHSSPSQGSLGQAGRRPGGHRAFSTGVWAEGAEGGSRGVPGMESLDWGGRRAHALRARTAWQGGGRRRCGGGGGAQAQWGRGRSFPRCLARGSGPSATLGATCRSGCSHGRVWTQCPRAQPAREDGVLGWGWGSRGARMRFHCLRCAGKP